MLAITKPNKVPHGGVWKYHDEKTGTDFAHPVIRVLEDKVFQFKKANGEAFDLTEFVQNVCRTTGQGICHDADDRSYNLMEKVAGVMAAARDHVKAGLAMAGPDILKLRLEKCEACPHWGGTRGASYLMGKCKVCGCRGIKLSLATSKCPIGRWTIIFAGCLLEMLVQTTANVCSFC